MPRVARTVSIDAPPERIWEVLVEIEDWPKWASFMRSLERQAEGPFGLGSRVKESPRGLPSAVWEVTEFEAPHSYTWTTQIVPGLGLTASHVVEAEAVGAKATLSIESSGALGLLLSPLLAAAFRRITRLLSQGLKAYCESTTP